MGKFLPGDFGRLIFLRGADAAAFFNSCRFSSLSRATSLVCARLPRWKEVA